MSSTRLAAIDVRSSARLVLSRTILSRGRTSGLYVSESAAVSLGAGCSVVDMQIAAFELETNAQLVCESEYIAQPIKAMIEGIRGSYGDNTEAQDCTDVKEKSDSIVLSCSTPVMVASGAAFGFLKD